MVSNCFLNDCNVCSSIFTHYAIQTMHYSRSARGMLYMFWNCLSLISIYILIPIVFTVVTMVKGVDFTNTASDLINFNCLFSIFLFSIQLYWKFISSFFFPSKFYPSTWIIKQTAVLLSHTVPWLTFSSP